MKKDTGGRRLTGRLSVCSETEEVTRVCTLYKPARGLFFADLPFPLLLACTTMTDRSQGWLAGWLVSLASGPEGGRGGVHGHQLHDKVPFYQVGA